jgi:hypothetical protein
MALPEVAQYSPPQQDDASMPAIFSAPSATLYAMSGPTSYTIYLPWSQAEDYSTSSCSFLDREQLGLSPVYPSIDGVEFKAEAPRNFNHGLFIDQKRPPIYTHTKISYGTDQPLLSANDFSLRNTVS